MPELNFNLVADKEAGRVAPAPAAAEVYRLLGYPSPEAASDEAHALVEEMLWRGAELAEPWAGFVYVDVAELAPDAVEVALQAEENGLRIACDHARDAVVFHSEPLTKLLHGCAWGVLCVVTIGERFEAEIRRLQEIDEPAAALVLDAVGSAAIEALQRTVGRKLCSDFEAQRRFVTRHYSPGYSGWHLSEQHLLFQLLRRAWDGEEADSGGDGAAGNRSLRVALTGDAVMRPGKSLSSIWGISQTRLNFERAFGASGCASCDLQGCDFRRVPYQLDLPVGVSETGFMQLGVPVGARLNDAGDLIMSAMNTDHHQLPEDKGRADSLASFDQVRALNYNIAVKALAKWTKNQLTWSEAGDGARQYNLKFEGSTCSGGGVPIGSTLHAIVRPAADGKVLFERGWATFDDDDPGLQSMCQFGVEGWAFPERLGRDTPEFSGQTIEHILSVTMDEIPLNPSGCFCKQPQVNHKWRMLLTTVHYAIAQDAIQKTARTSDL